jgi:hypothetical protein
MALPETNTMVAVGGEAVGKLAGTFSDYDGLVEALRRRAADVGLTFAVIDELSNLGESATAKYLSDLRVKNLALRSFFAISGALGVRAIFIEDDRLLAQIRPHWGSRCAERVHARPRVRLGATTLKRVRPAVLAELGRKGAAARNAALWPEVRRKLAQAAAKARWGRRRRASAARQVEEEAVR